MPISIQAGHQVPEFNSEEPRKIVSGDHWTAYYSTYDPDKGGINCLPPCNVTASGALVSEWWNKGAACPNELPFGTVVTLPGGEEVKCIDRFNQTHRIGLPWHPSYNQLVSKLMPDKDAFWLDVLAKDSPVAYGTPLSVRVQLP